MKPYATPAAVEGLLKRRRDQREMCPSYVEHLYATNALLSQRQWQACLSQTYLPATSVCGLKLVVSEAFSYDTCLLQTYLRVVAQGLIH
jgi:hypothetical protein